MPTYDYRCRKCGHQFELFHSMSDDTPRRCPKCRGRAVKVPSGGAGLLFKGSGFYITDYRSPGYHKDAKKESGAKSEGAAKSEGTSKGEGTVKGGAAGSSGGSEKPKSGSPKSDHPKSDRPKSDRPKRDSGS